MNVFPADDLLILVLVGVSGVTSGYINPSCFVVAEVQNARREGRVGTDGVAAGGTVRQHLLGAIMSFAVGGPALLPARR